MQILNSFVYDIFDRICTEAGKLCQCNKKQSMFIFSENFHFMFVVGSNSCKTRIAENLRNCVRGNKSSE